jgi:hypothetical protein
MRWYRLGMLLAALVAASAQAGIGDELNTSIKGLSDLQFSPQKGRVMSCFGINRAVGFAYTIFFMDGVEEGRIISRLDKGKLDTNAMNKAAQSYGAWKLNRTEAKVKYFYCAERGLWSHYNTVAGYPTYFIYSNKKPDYAIAMAAGKDAADRQMRKEKRTKWNVRDWNLMCDTFNRIMPLPLP